MIRWADRGVRWRDRALLTLTCAAFALIAIAWVIRYRTDEPFDIDESAYLLYSILDWRGLASGGVLGWVEAVLAPNAQAPLTSALGSLTYLLAGPRPVVAFIVPIAFLTGTIWLTFALARRRMPRLAAWLATLLVASTPLLIEYSRSFHMAAAATFMCVAALYCLERSDWLGRWGWSVAFGVSIGLIPLSRTMAVAFIPGLALAALAQVVAAPAQRGIRFGRLVVAGLTSIAVAALWLAPNENWRLVWGYLTNYGYGSASAAYGTMGSGWLSPITRSLQTLLTDAYLPHGLVYLAGFLLLVGLVGVRLVRRRSLPDAIRHPAFAPLVFALCGWAMLATSSNQGSAFSAPLFPAMAVCVGWALASLARPLATFIVVGAIAAASTIAGAPLGWGMGTLPTIKIGTLGSFPIVSSRGTLQSYLGLVGRVNPLDETLLTQAPGWLVVTDATAARFAHEGPHPLAIGFSHRLLNVNSIQLRRMVSGGEPFWMTDYPRVTGSDDVAAYQAWLTEGNAKAACHLLTMVGSPSEIAPPVTPEHIEAAATASGFHVLDQTTMPDGSTLYTWERPSTCG